MKEINLDSEDEKDNKFSCYYKYEHILGEGAFGKVVCAQDNRTGQQIAIKVINKKRVAFGDVDRLKNEADILRQLDHPNIVKFLEIKETKSRVLIAMEMVKGGTLQNLMNEKKKHKTWFTEREAADIIKNILEGLRYIHGMNIVHRDLKPDNILIDNLSDFSTLKIADFGLSAAYDVQNGNLSQQCGTLVYMAPEFFTTKIYSKPIDIWSCAIIMFRLCANGEHPLYNNKKDTEQTYKEKIKNPRWVFPKEFSEMAINFFTKITCLQPTERYSAYQALHHPWITNRMDDNIPLTLNEYSSAFGTSFHLFNVFKAVIFLNFLKKKMLDCTGLSVDNSIGEINQQEPDQPQLTNTINLLTYPDNLQSEDNQDSNEFLQQKVLHQKGSPLQRRQLKGNSRHLLIDARPNNSNTNHLSQSKYSPTLQNNANNNEIIPNSFRETFSIITEHQQSKQKDYLALGSSPLYIKQQRQIEERIRNNRQQGKEFSQCISNNKEEQSTQLQVLNRDELNLQIYRENHKNLQQQQAVNQPLQIGLSVQPIFINTNKKQGLRVSSAIRNMRDGNQQQERPALNTSQMNGQINANFAPLLNQQSQYRKQSNWNSNSPVKVTSGRTYQKNFTVSYTDELEILNKQNQSQILQSQQCLEQQQQERNIMISSRQSNRMQSKNSNREFFKECEGTSLPLIQLNGKNANFNQSIDGNVMKKIENSNISGNSYSTGSHNSNKQNNSTQPHRQARAQSVESPQAIVKSPNQKQQKTTVTMTAANNFTIKQQTQVLINNENNARHTAKQRSRPVYPNNF